MNTQLYEKIVKVKSPKQKIKLICAILFYVIYLAVWFFVGIFNFEKILLIFTFAILSLLMIILISWKYFFIEYEYNFCMSSLTVAKIYGKRKRKVLVEIDISKCLIICPVSEKSIEKAETFEPRKRFIAVSHESAEDIWMLLSNDEEDDKYIIFIESDTRVYSILKTVAPHITTKRT